PGRKKYGQYDTSDSSVLHAPVICGADRIRIESSGPVAYVAVHFASAALNASVTPPFIPSDAVNRLSAAATFAVHDDVPASQYCRPQPAALYGTQPSSAAAVAGTRAIRTVFASGRLVASGVGPCSAM